MSCLDEALAEVEILLYDNTPGGQEPGSLPEGVRYKADPANGGLAAAYNFAIRMAEDDECQWLLTLDQDTNLPSDFLEKMCHAAQFVSPMQSVAAIVPHILSDGRALSPFTLIQPWTVTKNVSRGFVGIPVQEVYAVNSGSMLKVSALKLAGGYDPRFPLDFSDLAIYHRLHRQQMRVFVAGDISVDHEVSGYDLKRRSSPSRYEDTYLAEEAAYDEWMGWVGRVVLTVRIVHRLVYQLWRNRGSHQHFLIGLKFLCRRVFYSRMYRIRSWERMLKIQSSTECKQIS